MPIGVTLNEEIGSPSLSHLPPRVASPWKQRVVTLDRFGARDFFNAPAERVEREEKNFYIL